MKFNDQALGKTEARTLEAALRALARTTDLHAEITAKEPKAKTNNLAHGRHRPEAIITVHDNGKELRYIAEIKTADRFAALGAIKNQLAHYDEPGLLVAPYITPEMARQCREADLQFIDTAGNAYLKAPGLHVLVIGQKRDTTDQLPATQRANTTTAMRVIFALLCKPELLNATYREMKDAAGVALGTVGWVFADLNTRGHLLGDGREGNRRFVDAKRLLNEWVTNYPIKLRPKLGARKFRATDPGWWKTVDPIKYGAQWGGEVAADILVNYREPDRVLIYLHGDPAKLIVEHRLRPDPNGNVEILDRFWNFEPDTGDNFPNLTPRALIYADLMATQDPRNHETAALVYERYIANALNQT